MTEPAGQQTNTRTGSAWRERWSRLVAWVRQHKIKSVLLLLAGYVLVELLTIPYFSIPRLKTQPPGQTALMRQRIDEASHNGKKLSITQYWVPLSRLPRHLINAVIVAEDGAFYDHGGIDWFEVQESIEKNVKERRAARGASTITQQLAKNLYLSTSKTPLRKVKEIIITLMLENQLSKNRILELYLNEIEWGRGIFGVEAASRTYFGKSASDLNVDEAARLAAVIPSPLRHRPDDDSRYVVHRRNIVLARMTARKFIEQAAPAESVQQPVPSLLPEPQGADTVDIDEDDPNGL